jgi:hypothetical protein
MRSFNASVAVFGLLLFFCGLLPAAETAEHRERITALRKQASEMAAQGKIAEAVKLLEAAAEPYDEAQGEPGIEKERGQGRERLQQLLARQQELRDAAAAEAELTLVGQQIARAQRELQVLGALSVAKSDSSSPLHARAVDFDAGIRRIHHLVLAAQNLQLAQERELANQTLGRATAVQQSLQAELRQLAEQMQRSSGEHGDDVVRALLAEIERLQAELSELRATRD